MVKDLVHEIDKLLNLPYQINEAVYVAFRKRLQEGKITRNENEQSHFGIHFLPFNKLHKKVFIVHHKKSNLWLTPGGHIEKSDTRIADALIREADEELGYKINKSEIGVPFLLTIKNIENPGWPCRKHYDIWFVIQTDGRGFRVNMEEFYSVQWLGFSEARVLIVDTNTLKALKILTKII